MTPTAHRLAATLALLASVAIHASPSDAVSPRPAPSRETVEAVANASGIVSDDGVRLWDTEADDASPIRELRFGELVYALEWWGGMQHVTNTPDTVYRVPVALEDMSAFGWVNDSEVGFDYRRAPGEQREAGLGNLPSRAESTFYVARSLLLPDRVSGRSHAEIERAARLLDITIDRYRDAEAEVWIQHRVGRRRELVAAYPYAAFLLGEARAMLREPRRAEAAFLRVIECQDARSVDRLYARRHLVKLYDGPLEDRGAATAVCHEIIREHGSTPVSDELTERRADVEAAEKIVRMWSRQPVDTSRLLAECAAITVESDDPAIAHLTAAGQVRARVELGQSQRSVDVAVNAIRAQPTVVRIVDTRAPWPYGEVHARCDARRVAEEQWTARLPGDESGSVLLIDYAFYSLAALVEGAVSSLGDYDEAARLLSLARDSLSPMSPGMTAYVRYLAAIVNDEGPAELRGGSGTRLGVAGGRDPNGNWDPQRGDTGPATGRPIWDPMRRRLVDEEYWSRRRADWEIWGGMKTVNGVIGEDGAVVKAGLQGGLSLDRAAPAGEPVHILTKGRAIVERDGTLGRWTKIEWGVDNAGWVLDTDIDDRRQPIFDKARAVPPAWPERGSRGPFMERTVIPYLGHQQVVVADVTHDGVPDVVAAGYGALAAIDGATRRIAWVHRRAAGGVPTVSDGCVFVEDTHEDAQYACALDAATGVIRWQRRLRRYSDTAVRPPPVTESHVFFASATGLSALARSTGSIVWTRRAVEIAGLVGVDRDLLIFEESATYYGDARVLVASVKDGSTVADLGRATGRVALTAGRAYVPRSGGLWIVDLNAMTGMKLWTHTAVMLPTSAPTFDGEDVYRVTEIPEVGRRRNRPNQLTAERRTWPPTPYDEAALVWNYRDRHDFLGDPTLTHESVLIASEDGSVHAVSRATGRTDWVVRLPERAATAPPYMSGWTAMTVAQNRVLMGWGGHLYILTPREKSPVG